MPKDAAPRMRIVMVRGLTRLGPFPVREQRNGSKQARAVEHIHELLGSPHVLARPLLSHFVSLRTDAVVGILTEAQHRPSRSRAAEHEREGDNLSGLAPCHQSCGQSYDRQRQPHGERGMQQHMQVFRRLAENLVGVRGPFLVRPQRGRAE